MRDKGKACFRIRDAGHFPYTGDSQPRFLKRTQHEAGSCQAQNGGTKTQGGGGNADSEELRRVQLRITAIAEQLTEDVVVHG